MNKNGFLPVKTVNHFEMLSEVFLCEMVQHPGVYKTLHEVGTVLRQAKTREPFVSNPFMVHIAICQRLSIEY